MKTPLRSKQGCWTCKLRRKKCDETRPHCSTCKSLGITCHGFGPKPDWMDNGDKERNVVNSLKESVKQFSRRKDAAQMLKHRRAMFKIKPKSSNDSGSDSLSNVRLDIQPSGAPSSLQLGPGVENDESRSTAGEQDESISGIHSSVSTEDSVLLMHFLDVVFPLQFPVFKPSILEGGRGWLLTFLLNSSALYHAALTLSVYHRRQLMYANTNHAVRTAALIQQETYLGISIKLMNQSVHGRCGTTIPITILQLMYFETEKLFCDNTSAWQTHLRALLNIGIQIHQQNEKGLLGLIEPAKQLLSKEELESDQSQMVSEKVRGYRFVSGTMIWLDIISAITTGKAPILLHCHSHTLASGSQIRCGDIMGCRNFMMLQIGRIAAQHEQKTLAVREGRFECTHFKQEAINIMEEIQRGLAEQDFQDLNLSKPISGPMPITLSDPQTLITRIFARMAIVYLHLVAHGFQDLESLSKTLGEAMEMIQGQIPYHLLPALVLPLFIIGTVAQQEDQQYFRDVLSSSAILDPMLKHRTRLLPILEEIWRRRQSTLWPILLWNDCLDLTPDVLLV